MNAPTKLTLTATLVAGCGATPPPQEETRCTAEHLTNIRAGLNSLAGFAVELAATNIGQPPDTDTPASPETVLNCTEKCQGITDKADQLVCRATAQRCIAALGAGPTPSTEFSPMSHGECLRAWEEAAATAATIQSLVADLMIVRARQVEAVQDTPESQPSSVDPQDTPPPDYK